jgi:ectoine hydroxylase-related dioxygenase (phytanoyl-CoA dioxygenase family)
MPSRVSPDTIEAFRQDGACVLRGVFTPWVETLGKGVDRNLAAPSADVKIYQGKDGAGRFVGDYCNWDRIPEYRDFIFNSGAAEIGRDLMGTRTVRLFHEHVLVKEPGATERTPWHHDQPYYCVDGDQNVSMWIALDPVPASSGVRFIAGSHRWNRWFVPRKFVDHTPYAEGVGRYELVPDLDAEIDADVNRHTVLAWDVEPGDVIAFHFRVLHDAPGTEALTHGRRAVSFRWLGDDATFALRPWLHSPPFEPRSLSIGGPLDDDRFPLVD